MRYTTPGNCGRERNHPIDGRRMRCTHVHRDVDVANAPCLHEEHVEFEGVPARIREHAVLHHDVHVSAKRERHVQRRDESLRRLEIGSQRFSRKERERDIVGRFFYVNVRFAVRIALSSTESTDFFNTTMISLTAISRRSTNEIVYLRIGIIDDADDRRLVSQIYRRSLLLHGLQQNREGVVEEVLLAFRVLSHRERERETETYDTCETRRRRAN